MEALEKKRTCEIVQLPKGKKPIGCKQAYMVKYKVDGFLEKYKGRLVAKGHSATHKPMGLIIKKPMLPQLR